ncbi:adhesin [Pseudomonas sp.]|uniref:adhesin n=1 Tax=Pseudomonas sp. TaxID=306 RepID=UPI00272A51D9|nr:adhesin [Pseudomonas sp.]
MSRLSLFLSVLVGFAPLLSAEPGPRDRAELIDSFHGVSGNTAVNQAAGNGHQQANVRMITLGTRSGASLTIEQSPGALGTLPENLDASALIQGQSFVQSSGVTGINQTAGIANQSLNVFRMALGSAPESVTDSVLSQSTSAATPAASFGVAEGERIVDISDTAFVGSRGVVQLNQSAGVGNRTTNSLSIRVADRP